MRIQEPVGFEIAGIYAMNLFFYNIPIVANFKTPDRERKFLMPPRLDEWIQDEDIVHSIAEAAGLVPMGDFHISHGLFSSGKIGRTPYNHIPVRFLCGNLHPDHDTICTFRRTKEKTIKSAFLYILKLAEELGILKTGTVSTDGTLIKANASIHNRIRYDRAFDFELPLTGEISQLLQNAEEADKNDEDDDKLQGDLRRLT